MKLHPVFAAIVVAACAFPLAATSYAATTCGKVTKIKKHKVVHKHKKHVKHYHKPHVQAYKPVAYTPPPAPVTYNTTIVHPVVQPVMKPVQQMTPVVPVMECTPLNNMGIDCNR